MELPHKGLKIAGGKLWYLDYKMIKKFFMVAGNTIRLSKLAREFNVGIHTIVEFLHKKGFDIDSNPNTKVEEDALHLLQQEYKVDVSLKKESEKISLKSHRPKKEVISIDEPDIEEEIKVKAAAKEVFREPVKPVEPKKEKTEKPQDFIPLPKEEKIKVVGKIDLDALSKHKKKEEKPLEAVKPEEPVKIKETAETEKPAPEIKKEEIKLEVKSEIIEQEIPAKVEKPVEPPVEISKERPVEMMEMEIPKVEEVKVVGMIDLTNINQRTRPAKKSREEKEKERKERLKQRMPVKPEKETPEQPDVETVRKPIEVIKAKAQKLNGPTVVGKIDLPDKRDKRPLTADQSAASKKRRKRIPKETGK
jgi:translation initiation factor IF-2